MMHLSMRNYGSRQSLRYSRATGDDNRNLPFIDLVCTERVSKVSQYIIKQSDRMQRKLFLNTRSFRLAEQSFR